MFFQIKKLNLHIIQLDQLFIYLFIFSLLILKLLIKQAYFNIDCKCLIFFLNDCFHDFLILKETEVTLADNSRQHLKKAAILHILKQKNKRISLAVWRRQGFASARPGFLLAVHQSSSDQADL